MQHFGKILAGLAIQPAHDAEIHRMDDPLGIDENIAGMQVGMKKAIPEDLQEKCLRKVRDDGFTVETLSVPVYFVHRGSVDPGGRHHAAACAQPVDRWH